MGKEAAESEAKVIPAEEAAALLLREARQLWENQLIQESLVRLQQASLLLRQCTERHEEQKVNLEAVAAIRSETEQFWALADGAAGFWRGAGTAAGVEAGKPADGSGPDGQVEEE